MLCLPSLVLLHLHCLTNYGVKMENNSKSVEEMNALKATFPQLLVNLDKVRFAVTQIAEKQQVLDIELQEKLDSLVKTLDVSCSTLSLLTASVYNYE